MSKYRLGWNESKFNRYLKEGRGSGKGKEYKPWLSIHDFPSKGCSTRTPGWKTSRVHHFMSRIEMKYFYLLEWSDIVVDIREQFPLLDIDDLISLSKDLGIRYPVDSVSKMPYVLTTDFMITVKIEGKEFEIARTIKPAVELEKKRVIEKFDIEREYWAARGVDWGIVTDVDLPQDFVKNVEWVHSSYWMEPVADMNKQEMLRIGEILELRIMNSGLPIRRVTAELDKELNMEAGACLYIFKHMIAEKRIPIDMRYKIDLGRPAVFLYNSEHNDSGTVMA